MFRYTEQRPVDWNEPLRVCLPQMQAVQRRGHV